MANCIRPIMQGDAYFIIFHVTVDDNEVDISKISVIEFMVGSLKKYYKKDDSDVTYDEKRQRFFFPLTQEETLAFKSSVQVQIRVKDISGVVIGKQVGSINIERSNSNEVL